MIALAQNRARLRIQTVIVYASPQVRTATQAAAVAKRHGATKTGRAEVPQRGGSWHFRQRAPGAFVRGSLRTVRHGPYVSVVMGRIQPKRRRNATPREWQQLPPNTPYGCASPYVGRTMPGKGGGLVEQCATPSASKPRAGQMVVAGRLVPTKTVKDRFRDATRGAPVVDDPIEVAARVDAAQREVHHVPAPIGLPFPHRRGSSVCDAEHKAWAGYIDALEMARERAAIAAEAEAARVYPELVAREFAVQPGAGDYVQAEHTCVQQIEARRRARKPKAVDSPQAVEGRRRARARAAGEDVTATAFREGAVGRTVARRNRSVVALVLTALELARWRRDALYRHAMQHAALATRASVILGPAGQVLAGKR